MRKRWWLLVPAVVLGLCLDALIVRWWLSPEAPPTIELSRATTYVLEPLAP